MDVERARAFLLQLPHAAETMQWGERLVFWVGEKALGGKMFAIMDLSAGAREVIAFAATAEHQAELCEREGIIRAPYLARAGWVAVLAWDALPAREWLEELRGAHAVIEAKLPARTRALLALPAKQRAAALAKRKRAITKADAAKPKRGR